MRAGGMDPRVAVLVREGRTVFYAFVGFSREYVESDDLDVVDARLALEDQRAWRAYRKWTERAEAELSFAAAVDAGFDAGEWSGPAVWRGFEARAAAVAARLGA